MMPLPFLNFTSWASSHFSTRRAPQISSSQPPASITMAKMKDASVTLDVLYQVAVGVGPAVAEELPGLAHLVDERQIEVGDDQLVLVLGADGDEVAARIAEVRRAVE